MIAVTYRNIALQYQFGNGNGSTITLNDVRSIIEHEYGANTVTYNAVALFDDDNMNYLRFVMECPGAIRAVHQSIYPVVVNDLEMRKSILSIGVEYIEEFKRQYGAIDYWVTPAGKYPQRVRVLVFGDQDTLLNFQQRHPELYHEIHKI